MRSCVFYSGNVQRRMFAAHSRLTLTIDCWARNEFELIRTHVRIMFPTIVFVIKSIAVVKHKRVFAFQLLSTARKRANLTRNRENASARICILLLMANDIAY